MGLNLEKVGRKWSEGTARGVCNILLDEGRNDEEFDACVKNLSESEALEPKKWSRPWVSSMGDFAEIKPEISS